MEEVVFIYVAFILSRFLSGMEDGYVSETEIELARTSRTQIQRREDKERRRSWHVFGGWKYLFVCIALAVGIAGVSWAFIPALVSLLVLQVIIFNPMINWVLELDNFFHLSDDGIDGFGKRVFGEKIYYFLNCVIFALSIFLIHVL